MLDLVSDCSWNPRYNMFVLTGFSQNFPVLVYVYQRTEEELSRIFMSGAGFQMGTDKADAYQRAQFGADD